MAWAPLASRLREGVPDRTSEGERLHNFPVMGWPEILDYADGCKTCDKQESHRICEWIGVQLASIHRPWWDMLQERQRVNIDTVQRVWSALDSLAFCQNGILKNSAFNAGEAGANIAQAVGYEIVNASGKTLTLRGRNPIRIEQGESILNPNWPAPGEPRFSQLPQACALPAGGLVEFNPPSVLFEKLTPRILKVIPPTSTTPYYGREGTELDDVEFFVECWENVANAMQPIDRAYPPADGKYYCTIYWYWFFPPGWPNWQPQHYRQWTKRTAVLKFGETTLTVEGRWEFRNSADGTTIVLYPGMGLGESEMSVVTFPSGGGAGVGWSNSQILERIRTENNVADLLVTDILSDEATDRIEVTYWCLARSEDILKRPFYGHCWSDQKDWSGSYVHGELGTRSDQSRRCMNVECTAFKEGRYRNLCWETDGDKFGFPGYGEPAGMGIENPQDGTAWSKWFTSMDLVLEQQIAGESSTPNFRIIRVGNPSLVSIFGAFAIQTPGGFYATRDPMHLPSMGQRVTWTDDDGDHQLIVHGWVAAEPYTTDADNHWEAGTVRENGFFPAKVSGWETVKNDPGVRPAIEKFGLMPLGRLHLYSYGHSGSWWSRRSERREEQQVTRVTLDMTTENTTLANSARDKAALL